MRRVRSVGPLLCAVAGRAAASLLVVLAAVSFAGDADLPVRDARDAVRAKLPPPDSEPFLGVMLEEGADRAVVAAVIGGSTAERAGIQPGDRIDALGALPVKDGEALKDVIDAQRPGEPLRIAVARDERLLTLEAPLGTRRRPDSCFRGARFELAVVPIAFADEPTASFDRARLERMLLTRTGSTDAGASVADYFHAQSLGRLEVAGRVLAPVVLPGPRARYAEKPMGGSAESAFAVAAERLAAREGAAIGGIDGIAFLYAGEAETRPGFAFWPHRSCVTVGGRRVPYYVHATSGDADAIGVHCHEFGHLLGLPDSYGASHLTGSGDFCLMSIGHRGGGASGARRPFSMCAWCRMRLSWIDPIEVDPRTPQRLRLRPVAGGDALLVPLTPTTREYLLLEVRTRTGFDTELPAAGLLVWHVGGAATPGQGAFGNYVNLVPAHGIDCADAALVQTKDVTFPTRRARDLTPRTRPSTESRAKDAFPVYVTDIEAIADGSIALTLGVARDVAQPAAESGGSVDEDGSILRKDPITGREVRLVVRGSDGEPAPVPESSEQRR